jgi:SpoIID/LytB domain protein
MMEPRILVALMQGASELHLEARGPFRLRAGGLPERALPSGVRIALRPLDGDLLLSLDGVAPLAVGAPLELQPHEETSCAVAVRDVTVGVDFHWEHREDLVYRGAMRVLGDPRGGLRLLNELPLETYLASVVSSEMSARCPPALLEAHAIISRSWLWAQIRDKVVGRPLPILDEPCPNALEIRRWYDREDHEGFDVCADDHCQRYQGVTRALSTAAEEATRATRGLFLTCEGHVCDARFSKCCGGFTERFATAWGDLDVPYLRALPDAIDPGAQRGPFDDEETASAFIGADPPAFCNTSDRALLERLLPGIDHDTRHFYRWEERIAQDELRGFVRARLDVDPGPILALQPLARGPSGRIYRLLVQGEGLRLVVGKELEVRRILSKSHLRSSAFVVRPEGGGRVPETFTLRGAGWGHGVGLCQIGAAVMADRGASARAILAHYFPGTALEAGYD